MLMRFNGGAPGSAWGGEALLYGQSIWIYGKVLSWKAPKVVFVQLMNKFVGEVYEYV